MPDERQVITTGDVATVSAEALTTPTPPVEKFPELRRLRDDLQAQCTAIELQSEPIRAERDRLLESIRPTLDRVSALERQYLSIEQPRLAELRNQLGAIARAMGGRSMSTEPTPTPET